MAIKLRRWAAFGVFAAIGFGLGMMWNHGRLDCDAVGAPSEMKVVLHSQAGSDTAKGKVTRIGQVIGLRPEKKDYYIELHANTWPSILKRIRESNIRNYSIYLAELEGKLYLFSYFEYVGDDFEGDMAKIAADSETQRWWKETDPCQIRLPGTPEGKWWMPIPEVFHTD
ncbi:MAG: L-rhamnose mutarotase [Thermogutta sp.]